MASPAPSPPSPAQPYPGQPVNAEPVFWRRRLSERRERSSSWWNRLVYVTTATSLYPLRVPPETLAPTPASSLATAAALGATAPSPPALHYGHWVVMQDACAHVSPAKGCAHGDVHTRLYDVTPRVGAASVLDDQARAAWIASATVEPAIAMVFGEALACVHGVTGLDLTNPVWRCPEALRPRDDAMARPCRTDPERLLRRTEEAFAAKAESTSINGPVSCAADYECLVRVAQTLVEECGAEAPLDVSERLQALAEANGALLSGVADKRGARHEDELRTLQEAHSNAIRAFGLQRIEVHRLNDNGDDDDGGGGGRRLEADPATGASPRLNEDEWRLRRATNATCRAIAALGVTQDATNATDVVAAHTLATRAWLLAKLSGNGPRGSGTVCVDCHFPRQTVACRVHFALVGQRMQQIHRDKRNAEQQHEAARVAAVQAHVRRKLNEACCVRMHDANGLPTGRKECGAVYCKHVAAHKRNERIARVLRQLHREDPEARAAAGIDLHIGLDLLDPTGHVDPLCRNRSRHDAECIGRSVVHHMAVKHGVDPQSVRRRIEAVGSTLGDGVRHTAKAMGLMREVRRAGAGADANVQQRPRRRQQRQRQRQRADDARVAAALLRRHRREPEGRRLATESTERAGTQLHPDGVAHAVEQHFDDAAVLVRRARNASVGVSHELRAIDVAAMNAATMHMADLHGPRARPSVGRSMAWDTLVEAVGSPGTHMALVQTEHGSITTAIGGALRAVATVRRRLGAAWDEHERRIAEHRKRQHRRQLAADRAQTLYDRLEALRRRRRLAAGRRLDVADADVGLLSLPQEHALSWVHDLGIDWRGWAKEGARVARVLRQREERRAAGHVDHAATARLHPTGYWLLDAPDHVQPSALGDALRRLSWRERHNGQEPPWHEARTDRRIRRRLYHGGAEDHVPKDVDAGVAADPPILRRMSEAFVEGTLAAPFAFFDTRLPGGQIAPRSKESFWVATARYAVAGTAGAHTHTHTHTSKSAPLTWT